MLQVRFRGKTWIYWAQLVAGGGIGLVGVLMGALIWAGMRDVKGEIRPDAGPPLVIMGCCFLAVGALAGFNIVSRIPPLIRCYREGIECNVIGATSIEDLPLLPGLVHVAWRILSLQGFRSQRVRILWAEFGGAQVVGIPMAYVLVLKGAFTNLTTGTVTYGLSFEQVALEDHPQDVADRLNELGAQPSRREQLSPWPINPSRDAARTELARSSCETSTAAALRGKDQIVATYAWTQRDYVATQRIGPLMQRSGSVSRVVRGCWFLFLHLLVPVGPIVAYRSVSGNHAKDIHIAPGEVGFFMLVSVAALYALYHKWYGVRWKRAREFRSLKLDNLRMTFKFDHEGIEVASNDSRSRIPWSSVARFVAFRDGFLMFNDSTGYWVPNRAFVEPNDLIKLVETAKLRAGRFEYVNRSAAS